MMLRVLPIDEDMMKHLKHPSGVKFGQLRPCPMDGRHVFTTRRLHEGAIKIL